jgi:putative redox protein
MTVIQVTHLANSRYQVAVGRHCLTVDQPETAGGDDQGPTAVQLFAASLVACTAHYAGSH